MTEGEGWGRRGIGLFVCWFVCLSVVVCWLLNLLDTMHHFRGFAGPPCHDAPLEWLYTCPTASFANANERAL